jgi:hypothetical protein
MPPFNPRAFIARANWTFASTVADWHDWPHEYAVEAKHEGDPDFARFVKLIAEEGYDARFEGHRYRYLAVDGFLYWSSRSLFSPGQNLNRRPASDVEGRPEHEQGRLPV